MKITFNIHYHTVWGQTLHLVGSLPELGAWDTNSAKEMQYSGDGNWQLEIEIPNRNVELEYRYLICSNGQQFFEEWEKKHCLLLSQDKQSFVTWDVWQNRPHNFAFFSSAFTQSLLAHPDRTPAQKIQSRRTMQIKAWAPYLTQDQSLALVGNQEALGNWDADKALVFGCENFPEWELNFDAADMHYPVEYKLLIINNADRSVVRWEKGENRMFNHLFPKDKETVVLSGLQFRDDDHNWRCAGLVIPVFSLRSEESFGIGDFGDLHKIVDWVKLTDQKMIQILPINDTTMTHTWVDSYPYNAISIYALHPLYLELNAMGTLRNTQRKTYFQELQQKLNALPAVDYEQVDQFKWEFFREIFDQEGDKTLKSKEYLTFFENNKEWLTPYAAYSYLRDKNGTPDFHFWKNYSVYHKEKIDQLCSPETAHYKEIAIYYFLQFHLHKQLTKVRDYCYANGVVLKGDIPIGISNVSIEAWTEPAYFNIDAQAGAPPDDFSIKGQNWGFPTYNWDAMEADQYSWWKKRFRKMSDYFDAYRIDHILGFFRIWEIPQQSLEGLLGYFNPSIPFSMDEIWHSGLNFNKEHFTRASVGEWHLEELFGEYASEVQQIYLDRINSDRFILKTSFNTQRKISVYFEGKDDPKSQRIKAGLMAICNEVLFIEDKEQPNHYHPRISAAVYSFIYKELSYNDQRAFDSLYGHYFYQRHNEFWKEQALKHLTPLVNSTGMLACGE
ncbi:MAG: 4-alpha-glucanotransferase, partial [Dysgonamonadaceae bacterium]|nr:4-alpha-glucanotransferase [Dysgonamonadaceae bacterium]